MKRIISSAIFLVVVFPVICLSQSEGRLLCGEQGSFPFAKQIVFLVDKDSVLFVECFFPLKGSIFKILDDTLYRAPVQPVFWKGLHSYIVLDDSQMVFSTDSLFTGYKVVNVSLLPCSDKQELLTNYRKRAKPWSQGQN